MWHGIRRWGAGIAIGAVAAAALLGGASFVMAQSTSSPSTIQACVNRLGMIRIVKWNNCASYETYTTWNRQGEQGPPGEPGSAGEYEVTFSDSFLVPVSLGGQTLHCDAGDVAVNRSASILPDPVSSDLTSTEVWEEVAPGQWQEGWRFTATNITPQTSTLTAITARVFCLDRGDPHAL
ncbi:MAG: hypothetical protein AB7L91_14115 [Dehalococcoidia bacterium]